MQKKLRYDNLLIHLKFCGSPVKYIFRCKKCQREEREDLLKEIDSEKSSCGVRYCKNPHCVSKRYAQTIKRLLNTKYLTDKGWKKLTLNKNVLHISLSFQRCKVDNIKATKKQLDRIINYFFQKLRKGSPCPKGFRKFNKKVYNPFTKEYKWMPFFKKNNKDIFCFDPINLQGIKVFDIKYYFENGEWLLHYHLAIIPHKNHFIDYNILQYVRKEMIKNSKSKRKWHLQVHPNKERKDNYKKAKGVLIYFTKRAIGIYGKADKYDKKHLSEKKIADIVNDKKIYFFSDIMNVKEYFDNFYNSKVVTYFGNVKGYIYNDVPFVTDFFPTECKFCGKLSREDILLEVKPLKPPDPPPDPQESPKITYIKIERNICKSCFHEFSQEDMHEAHLCKFCYNNSGSRRKINKFNEQFK